MSATRSTVSARGAYVPDEPYALLIGGERVATPDTFAAIDPSVGEEWTRIPQAGAAHVDRAVEAARRAFVSWRRSTPAQRQEALWRMADRIEADPDRWARLLATENGRPIREAHVADVPDSAAILRYFSGLARDLRGDHVPLEDGASIAYAVREPLGVVGALIPWNSPIITLANKVAPALACGNTVVIKPSEYASASVLEWVALVADCLPPGVLNVVTGLGPETGAALAGHPDVAKLTFTGGTATARRVMAAAAEAITPSLMELGGKASMIVCPDADLDTAVADALLGSYLANGQACVASTRLLVHDDVREAFTQRLVATAEQIVVGDALDIATQVGPLVSEGRRDAVLGSIEAARAQGATVLAGGGVPALGEPQSGGWFVAPTVLADPGGSTVASSEEIFGPVTVVESWVDEAEAVARANATRYGLASGVWTSDLARAHRMAGKLEAGIVWVNRWFDLPAGMPMGGVGESGFGRELCADAMREYSAPKAVDIGLALDRPPLWGP